jgi:DNA gyrase/topoisomerase IV subunit A
LFSNFQDLSNVFPLKQIPYQTNKASLVEKIAELVEDKVLLEKNVI